LSERIGQEQLWIVEKGQFVGLVFGGCLELAGCRSKGEKPPGPLLGFVWANVSRGTFFCSCDFVVWWYLFGKA
jgi:hypothetical protein